MSFFVYLYIKYVYFPPYVTWNTLCFIFTVVENSDSNGFHTFTLYISPWGIFEVAEREKNERAASFAVRRRGTWKLSVRENWIAVLCWSAPLCHLVPKTKRGLRTGPHYCSAADLVPGLGIAIFGFHFVLKVKFLLFLKPWLYSYCLCLLLGISYFWRF